LQLAHRAIQGRGDLVVERLSRLDVARRDPARHAAPLQLADNLQRGRPVLGDVADEQEALGVRHDARTVFRERAAGCA
jgi:hypothetical protein